MISETVVRAYELSMANTYIRARLKPVVDIDFDVDVDLHHRLVRALVLSSRNLVDTVIVTLVRLFSPRLPGADFDIN